MSSEETLVEKKTKVLIKLRGYKVLSKEEIKNANSYTIKMKDGKVKSDKLPIDFWEPLIENYEKHR